MTFINFVTITNRSQEMSQFLRFSALALLLLLVAAIPGFAQPETSNWIFGQNAGLHFPSSGSPTPFTSSINTSEGSSSISDSSGNLLFYTDGITVWGKNGHIMPGGTGLNGHFSSTNSGVIVRCSCNKYFIFTADAAENHYAKGLQYSVVDMTSGSGNVVSKNTVLLQPAAEKVTAYINGPGSFWVVAHGFGNNQFYAWHVTPDINCDLSRVKPVTSAVGTVYSGGSFGFGFGQGQMKFSQDGTMLAEAGLDYSGLSFIELFSFNATTGAITAKFRDTSKTNMFYGVEFAPNNQYLYIGITSGSNKLYRYSTDATITTNLNFTSSKTLINDFAVANSFQVGQLQLGPDGKIYIARNHQPYLSALTTPNLPSPGFVNIALPLVQGTTSGFGLPFMLVPRCDPLPPVDPCCPPWNSAMLKKMMFYQGTGGIGDSYTLKFQPSAALNMSMLAYLNYLHTMNFGITSITITFKLIDLSNNNQILETQSATWTWPNGTPTLGFFYHLMNTNNWYRVDTIISLNGTNQFFSEKCIHNWIDVNVQVQGRVKILHMRSADGGISETRINSENQ
ncbi:MAG: hypothetical protein DMG65_03140, partial [Candidatus Angelobacter sp. Gp1-AA117]